MNLPLQQPALQRATLSLYGELVCRRVDWRGKLVLAAFAGVSGTGISAAASLAGAASLVVDGDTAAVHASNREGAFDFVVNSLDEALRALKNEVRQGRPLAVALTAEPRVVLDEAAERGLAPDFLLAGAGLVLPAGLLRPVCPVLVSGAGVSEALAAWLQARDFGVREIASVTPGNPGQRSYAELVEGDPVRRVWLRDLLKYQRSARRGGRWCWMSGDEAASLGLERL